MTDEMDTAADAVRFVAEATLCGGSHVWAIATGGEPDIECLDRMVKGLDMLRDGVEKERMYAGWLRPTEEDVAAARSLAQLVREGAPREALVEPAMRVYGIQANPGALYGLAHVLLWLAGEARRIAQHEGPPKPDHVRKALDEAAAYFERGGTVAGFVPTLDDLASVRRLRELVVTQSEEELAERRRIAKELWARLPQDDVSAGVRRILTNEEGMRLMPDGEEIMHLIMHGIFDAEKAALAVATGGEPDLELLDRLAQAMPLLEVEIAEGRWPDRWVRPTEEKVSAARRLAQLVREGAPREDLVELAWYVYGIVAYPGVLSRLSSILPWLAGEATRIAYGKGPPDLDCVRTRLDEAAAYFERGGDVDGFVPTPEDLARARRLRDLVTAGGEEELAERHRLAKELWARLPEDYRADVRRGLTEEGDGHA
jgi:hypothetical protein